MNKQERDAIRHRHRASDTRPYLCETCHHSYFPCDAIKVLNAYERLVADNGIEGND